MADPVSTASSTSAQTLLAANSARQGFTITNTDANALYVLLDDGTPSATNYSVKLATDDVYENTGGYRGVVKGVWAADGSGVSLATEWTGAE